MAACPEEEVSTEKVLISCFPRAGSNLSAVGSIRKFPIEGDNFTLNHKALVIDRHMAIFNIPAEQENAYFDNYLQGRNPSRYEKVPMKRYRMEYHAAVRKCEITQFFSSVDGIGGHHIKQMK